MSEFSQYTEALHEECGVFGMYDKTGETDMVSAVYSALYALQHRGQESCGIALNVDGVLSGYRDLGLVSEVFTKRVLEELPRGAKMATGHVRYATAGQRSRSNAQPMVLHHCKGAMAVCHNGNLVNAPKLRRKLEMSGSIFHGTSDTEVIAYLLTQNRLLTPNIEMAVSRTMDDIEGAYSLVIMTHTKLIAARDPNGFRPLCIGELPDGRGWAVSSETCGLDIVGAQYVRDVEPGEIVRFNRDGMHAEQGVAARKSAACIFEYVYFARPDSVIDGQSVYQARRNMGRILAQEAPVEADLVLGVPDSGVPSAMGYAFESGIPYADGIVKNRYVGRTFIEPTQAMRQLGIRLKLNPLRSVIEGKRLVVIDDSIVRGNTSKKLVQMLRDAGAAEVHLRIVSPEVLWPCFYGIDTDTRDQLIAANMDLDEMNAWIGSDSLAFISLEGLRASVPDARRQGFCDACFTGDYPVAIPDSVAKKSLLTKKDFEETYGEGAADEARPRTR